MGHERITWEYYDIFEEIFIDDRTINIGPIISSMNPLTTIQYSSPTSSLSHSPTSTASSSIIASTSSLILSPSRLLAPTQPLSPSAIRYVYYTSPTTKLVLQAITRTAMDSPNFYDATFAGNSFFANITNSSSYSSSSSCCSSSVESEPAFEHSSKRISPHRQRKRINSKEKYDQWKQLLAAENVRTKKLDEIKQSIDENNKILQERNDLLKELLKKI